MVDLALFAHRKYQDIRLFKIIMVFFHPLPFANRNICGDSFIMWKLQLENFNYLQCSELTSVHIWNYLIYTFTRVTRFHKSHCHRRFFLYFILETCYILCFTHCLHILIKKERLLLWYPLHEAGHFHYCGYWTCKSEEGPEMQLSSKLMGCKQWNNCLQPAGQFEYSISLSWSLLFFMYILFSSRFIFCQRHVCNASNIRFSLWMFIFGCGISDYDSCFEFYVRSYFEF